MSCIEQRRKEMFYLTTHSTHFIYGYMVSDIWLRTILIVREETCCCHMGYSFWLAARVLLYAPPHRQDSTYHSLCYTSCRIEQYSGARCSSVVRVFTHGAMDCRIDPSWAISCFNLCSMTGVIMAMVCAILSVGWCILKKTLLLTGKSSPSTGRSRFPLLL